MGVINTEQFFNSFGDYLIIDVRSEKEFVDFSIVGAYNIPILNNEEKAIVGTTYKQNQKKAYRIGLEIGSKKLPSIYDEVVDLMEKTNKKKILFYCFRGGTRSQSVFQSLQLTKLDCYILEGGIKAYRNHILKHIDDYVNNFDYLVVTGNTGCGKTKYLKKLSSNNHPVIDFEGIANNRGSIFGSVGLGRPNNQKDFDAKLFFELRKYKGNNVKVIIVESESRKIGNCLLPSSMMGKLRNGRHLLISSSISKRVEIIKEDYLCYDLNKERISKLVTSNSYFMKKLGKKWTGDLLECLNNDNMDLFIEMLLVDYYDAFYEFAHEEITISDEIDSDDEVEIVNYISKVYRKFA